MIEADSNAMDVKRDLLNQRMKERHQQREMEISRCFEDREGLQTLQFNLLYFFRNVSSSEKSTEELVLIFYKDLDPEVEEVTSATLWICFLDVIFYLQIESMMGKIELLNEAEVGTELDNIVIKLQKIQVQHFLQCIYPVFPNVFLGHGF